MIINKCSHAKKKKKGIKNTEKDTGSGFSNISLFKRSIGNNLKVEYNTYKKGGLVVVAESLDNYGNNDSFNNYHQDNSC